VPRRASRAGLALYHACMSDLDSALPSRVCPSCGRRVPGRIEVCRCGANLAGVTAAPATNAAPRPSPVSPNASASRECPSCGRRVPPKIDVCRCGTKLPPVLTIDIPGDDQPLPESDFEKGFPTVLGVAAFMCCLVVFLYWLGKPPVRTPRPPPPTLEMLATPRKAETDVLPAPVETPSPAPIEAPITR
jgi:endogenous inhibitor of DNA gyrase (YacG/DUF329 family)